LSLPIQFPTHLPDLEDQSFQDDYNPAIRLFGKRFINGQTILEFLSEFMSVVFSEKQINEAIINQPLPSFRQLQEWPKGIPLKYNPPIKLNLKLFALLGVSRVESRHKSHINQFEVLADKLKQTLTGHSSDDEVLKLLEGFLQGFRGVGFNRTWCAQSFYPISTEFLTRETIWKEREGQLQSDISWAQTLNERYYAGKRSFLARGGELLYLHLCNAFSTDPEKIREFGEKLLTYEKNCLAKKEQNVENLHQELLHGFANLKSGYLQPLDDLANYIEKLDEDTHQKMNSKSDFLNCGWCPQESWQEGYLFAIELSRLLNTSLDPVDRIELLMTGCSIHVLRSLCAQSLRYSRFKKLSETLGYAWIFTSYGSEFHQNSIASQRNLESIQVMIRDAIYSKELQEHAQKGKTAIERINREAESKYGHKLFLSLGKHLGIIAPKKGPGARFIMTDQLLRYLVIVLIRPGERCTYSEFLQRLFLHFGIAVEGVQLEASAEWSGLKRENRCIQAGSWLQEMLRASGFLFYLSDACSIVENPFARCDS
jgi:hypothetical protein